MYAQGTFFVMRQCGCSRRARKGGATCLADLNEELRLLDVCRTLVETTEESGGGTVCGRFL